MFGQECDRDMDNFILAVAFRQHTHEWSHLMVFLASIKKNQSLSVFPLWAPQIYAILLLLLVKPATYPLVSNFLIFWYCE